MKVLHLRYSVLGIIALFVFAGIGCSSASKQGVSLDNDSPARLSSSAALVNSQEEVPGKQLEAMGQVSLATDATYLEADAPLDGASLLQIHCAKCHSVKLLEMTEKPPSYWEKILSRMEGTRVSLNDAERNAILDYLVNPDKS